MKKKNTQPAVTYIRTATTDKAQANAQGRTLRKFADKNGYTIVKEYADKGYSGITADRPGLKQLLRDVAKSKDRIVILINDADRLARNYGVFRKIWNRIHRMGAAIMFTNSTN